MTVEKFKNSFTGKGELLSYKLAPSSLRFSNYQIPFPVGLISFGKQTNWNKYVVSVSANYIILMTLDIN